VPGAPPQPPAWRHVARARTPLLEIYAESWHVPAPLDALRGMRLVADAPPPAGLAEAVTRAIVRSNPRMPPLDALELATHAIGVAEAQGLDPGFFCSTLLQESGFSPDALSPAGAVGIAQFTVETADDEGVDPFDWRDAMRGSAQLLGGYLRDYEGVYDDPYAATLAAYNAGPGAVSKYHGVPPYAETHEYIADIYDRWARVVLDTMAPLPPPPARRIRGRKPRVVGATSGWLPAPGDG
jgi:soluble lytic murein transglycosylase-like protein